MFIPVIYHGSITQAHGPGLLIGTSGESRYVLRVTSGELTNVHRDSFTIVDDDPANKALAAQFQEVSA